MEVVKEFRSLEERPQSLCKMCGRCCRVVTNGKYSYDEILSMAKAGNEYAKDFVKIFIPYNSIEEARLADKSVVDNVISTLKAKGLCNLNTLTFYYCRYVLDNNLCSIYEERPALCKVCPSSGWAVTPPGCGFEPWLFLRREEVMERVRKHKEELIELQIMKRKTRDEKLLQKIYSVERKLNAAVDLYTEKGSKSW